MTTDRIKTKNELLPEIEKCWLALNAVLEQLSVEQITTLTDEQGWTVKDHLIHLRIWERSVVFFLQGKPRHEGLGVEESTYLNKTDDEINAVIQPQFRHFSLDKVIELFRATHNELWGLLQPLSDKDLNKSYRHYLPNEPGDGDGPPAINVIYGNTAHHFREHLGWIESLIVRE